MIPVWLFDLAADRLDDDELVGTLERWDTDLEVEEPGSLDTVARDLGSTEDPPEDCARWDLRDHGLLTPTELELARRYRRIYPWLDA